jgi:hypothetical protein
VDGLDSKDSTGVRLIVCTDRPALMLINNLIG